MSEEEQTAQFHTRESVLLGNRGDQTSTILGMIFQPITGFHTVNIKTRQLQRDY